MISVPKRAVAAAILAFGAAACQPTDRVITVGADGSGGSYLSGTPEYAPDDPCKGVVPELCPR